MCSAVLGLMKLVIGVHDRKIYFLTVACKQEHFMYSAHIKYSNSSPAFLYYLITNCSSEFKNYTELINRKLNWETIWIDACPHYTKMCMRGNKTLSNLRVRFGVIAEHRSRNSIFGPLRTKRGTS